MRRQRIVERPERRKVGRSGRSLARCRRSAFGRSGHSRCFRHRTTERASLGRYHFHNYASEADSAEGTRGVAELTRAHTTGSAPRPLRFKIYVSVVRPIDRWFLAEVLPHERDLVDAAKRLCSGTDEARNLVQAVRALPERCRTVFERCRVVGQSPRAIAEELGPSLSTLGKRLARAIHLLTVALEPRRGDRYENPEQDQDDRRHRGQRTPN